MTRFKRGDVLLLPFPFSDVLAEKQRPAVVVSTEAYMKNGVDVIVAMISSSVRLAARVGDHRLADWQTAGLRGPSVVRMRLSTIHGKRVARKLGSVSRADMGAIDRALRGALGL